MSLVVAAPSVRIRRRSTRRSLRLPSASLAAMVALLITFGGTTATADESERHPDWQRREGIPRGEVTEHTHTTPGDAPIYPGTKRYFSVYKPAAMVDGTLETPAALMVFLDGHAYVREGSEFNTPAVLDNLIAAGDIPPMVAVFIDPGFYERQLEDGKLPEKRGWNPRPGNRSVEYDTVSDEYGRWLHETLLPAAYEAAGIDPPAVSINPLRRGLCGSSSGGICAFKVAWFNPSQFAIVISHIGSFTDIRGGHNFPPMVRKEDKRPLRVVLQDGTGDLDNQFGNWWLANQQMAAALAFREYDHKTYWGEGGHNQTDGGRIFPDEMKWLWRDWRKFAEQ